MLSNNRISGLFGLFLAALVISGCSSTATAPVEQQEPVAEPPVAAAPVEEVQEPEDFAEDGVTPLDANGHYHAILLWLRRSHSEPSRPGCVRNARANFAP